MAKFTHVGIVRGTDARTPDKYAMRIRLRQTKTTWVQPNGIRWRKLDGLRVPRAPWQQFRLDLSSVKEAPDDQGDCLTDHCLYPDGEE